MPDGYTEQDVRLVAEATQRHHIESGRTDASGNSPCVCDRWWDSSDGAGWDEHMAEVALSALAGAGRLLPADARACEGGAMSVQVAWTFAAEGDDSPFPAFDECASSPEGAVAAARAFRASLRGQGRPVGPMWLVEVRRTVSYLPHEEIEEAP